MKKRHFLVVLLLFSALTFSIFSCKKQIETNAATETNKVEKLVVQLNQPVSGNYQSLVNEFKGFSEDELFSFWEQMGKVNLENGVFSAEQEKTFLSQMKQYNDYSIKQYNKTFNRLDGSELQSIIYPASRPNTITPNRPIDPPPPGDCPFYYYSFFYTIFSGETPSPAALQYQDVKQYNGDVECNAVEYIYSGTQWTNMYPITAYAAWLMGTPNSWPWNVRKNGGFTYVYAPKSFVINNFGSLANFNNNVRLCMHFVSDE